MAARGASEWSTRGPYARTTEEAAIASPNAVSPRGGQASPLAAGGAMAPATAMTPAQMYRDIGIAIVFGVMSLLIDNK